MPFPTTVGSRLPNPSKANQNKTNQKQNKIKERKDSTTHRRDHKPRPTNHGPKHAARQQRRQRPNRRILRIANESPEQELQRIPRALEERPRAA